MMHISVFLTAMEEVENKNARYPESLYNGEKANFRCEVCLCECPLRHSEAHGGLQ